MNSNKFQKSNQRRPIDVIIKKSDNITIMEMLGGGEDIVVKRHMNVITVTFSPWQSWKEKIIHVADSIWLEHTTSFSLVI